MSDQLPMGPVARAKIAFQQERGLIVNGVALFEPKTRRRGLVDHLGYVGWLDLQEEQMTKEMKIKALARIQQAAQKFKDDETLGEAVREALAELAADEKAHREAAKTEHEANLAKKQA